MGMFDTIYVEVPLPGGFVPIGRRGAPTDFQTKDLECVMATYRLAAPGLLLEQHWEPVTPEPLNEETEAEALEAMEARMSAAAVAERSGTWGTDAKPSPLAGLFGILAPRGAVREVWTPVSYSGELHFYGHVLAVTEGRVSRRRKDRFVDFVARLEGGRLREIRCDGEWRFTRSPQRGQLSPPVRRRDPRLLRAVLTFPTDPGAAGPVGAGWVGQRVRWDAAGVSHTGLVLDAGADWAVVQPDALPLVAGPDLAGPAPYRSLFPSLSPPPLPDETGGAATSSGRVVAEHEGVRGEGEAVVAVRLHDLRPLHA